MSTVSTRRNPRSTARASTSLRSRTPQRGFWVRRLRSKADVARARVPPIQLEGTVEHQESARRQVPPRPAEQTDATGPGRNVNQIRAVHDIEDVDRPALRGDVEQKRLAHVGRALELGPRCNRRKRARIRLGGQPVRLGQACRKEGGVLAGPARHFEHPGPLRNMAAQYLEDRGAVSLCRRSVAPGMHRCRFPPSRAALPHTAVFIHTFAGLVYS